MVFAFTVKLFIAAFKNNWSALFLVYLYREISLYFINRALIMFIALKTSRE